MTPQAAKYFMMLEAASETNGGTITSNKLDLKGYRRARIIVWATTAATNKAPSVLKLSEADDTTTSVTDIAEFTGGSGFSIPTPEGTQYDGTRKPYVVFEVDARKRKRYLTLTVVPTTTQTYFAVAELLNGEEVPNSAAEANARAYVAG